MRLCGIKYISVQNISTLLYNCIHVHCYLIDCVDNKYECGIN